MQRSLRITLAVAAATGAVALSAGTAFADDNSGPVNVDPTQSSDSATHGATPSMELPTVNGHKIPMPDLGN